MTVEQKEKHLRSPNAKDDLNEGTDLEKQQGKEEPPLKKQKRSLDPKYGQIIHVKVWLKNSNKTKIFW